MKAKCPVLAVLLLVGAVAVSDASTKRETGALTEENDSILVRCPDGQRVVLGGMQAQFDDDQYSYIEELARPAGRMLRVGSYVPSPSPPQLTTIAT